MTRTKPETRYNVPLLEQVRKIIEDESRHKQSIWASVKRSILHTIKERYTPSGGGGTLIPVSCGTSACVAGWAAQAAGAKMLVNPEELSYDKDGFAESNFVLTMDGRMEDIGEYAAELLGLTNKERYYLFAADWTNEQVLENLDALIVAGNHGMEWDFDVRDRPDYDEEYGSDDDDY